MDALSIIVCAVLVCSYIIVFALGAGLGYLFLPRGSQADFAAPTSFLKSQGKPTQKNNSIEIDDTKVVLKVDTDGLEKKFDKIESGSGESLQNYLDDAGEKYRVAVEKFIYKPSLSALEFMELDLLKRLGRLNLFKPISKHIREYFKDPRLIKLLEFPSLLLGAKPSNTPALYSIMNYADLSLGTWYPNGGIRAIATGLYQNALDHNVEFLFNHPVSKIETKNDIVDHILVYDKKINCDIVVGGADYHHIENHLMDEKNRNYNDNYWDKRTMSPSSLLFYLGINKELDIPHHALFFDTDFDKHAEEIYDKPQWPKNPLFYVSCTSKTDINVAPKGSEAVFILVPVAPGLNDNENSREIIFQQIVNRLENALGTNIKDSIVFKRSYAHKEFISDFNSYKGNAYGLANTLFQTAIFKPRIKNKKLTNMYYCGQLTVPGPGMPPSLVSGKIVAKQIIKEHA